MVGPNTKVLGVKEYHRTSGYHFHFLILSQGIRKNTYKEDFRNLFSEFPGMTLDVQGVKSFRAAVDYILKQVRVPELFALHIGTGTGENIYSTEPIVFWLSPIQKKALVMLGDIRKFGSYDDFIQRNLDYAMLHGNKKAYITSIWNISQRLEVIENLFPTFFKNVRIQEYLDLCNKYQLSNNHIAYLRYVLYFLCIKDGYFPQEVKTKNLYVCGPPNVGKTSLLTKMTLTLKDPDVFYYVGSRPNDFTGYKPKAKPILVFDDVFVKDKIKWDTGLILKVLGHEKFKVDVKYDIPVTVLPRNVIIVSNRWDLFSEVWERALRARLKLILFNKDTPIALWLNIEDEEFINLCGFVLEDLTATINTPLAHFIKYGFMYSLITGKSIISDYDLRDYDPTPDPDTGY